MTELPSGTRASSRLDLAIRCLDLTSLDGSETREWVIALCHKALRPDADDPTVPSVAAVVLYPALVPIAVETLKGTGVSVASVAGFPGAEGDLGARLEEIRGAVDAGAEEVDIVMNRALFLSGEREAASREISLSKEAAGSAVLKVILESGELGTQELVGDASRLSMSAGADFLKSSTGKTATGVTPEAARTMMEAARGFHQETGRAVGIKLSGGIRTARQALGYLEMLEETLGRDWLTPARFRLGASALLDDLIAQLHAEER